MDKAGNEYWDQVWTTTGKKAIDEDYIMKQYSQYFERIFEGKNTIGMKLLEVGCANSLWLPYFSQKYGFEVHGVDYSEVGCDQERKLLNEYGVEGHIHCCDLFHAPLELAESFDVVVSFGLVEHFEDTSACVSALARFLKPEGTMITSIPNMKGIVGTIQKLVNRPVYNIHVPLNQDDLHISHISSGLKPVETIYFINSNFGVCNLQGIQKSLKWVIKKVLIGILSRISMFLWKVDKWVKPSEKLSPYIICVAVK